MTTIEYTLNGQLLKREILVNQKLSEQTIKDALHTLCLTELEKTTLTSVEKCNYMKNVAWAEVFQDGIFIKSYKILENYNG